MSAPTDEELAALTVERRIMDIDERAQAERLFTEALPAAVLSLIDISRNGASERNRIVASQYIIERNLGRLQDIEPNAGHDPFERLLAECVKEQDTKAVGVIGSLRSLDSPDSGGSADDTYTDTSASADPVTGDGDK